MQNNKKVSIIGMGNVGASIAYALMLRNLASEIALIDINQNVVNSEMLDIKHGIHGISDTKIVCGDYSDIKDSDLIIITAGRNRRPNESRLDLTQDNLKIAEEIAKNIEKNYSQGIVLIISNPVDVVTYYMTKRLNLPKGKVFGSGCILDSSRFVSVLSDYLKVAPELVDATVIGEHGELQVPFWSDVKVNNTPLEQYCKENNVILGEQEKAKIEQKVLKMGMEIILGKGKTCYGIATCVSHLADAILNNKLTKASVATCFEGNYGLENVALSLPCLIDRDGAKLIEATKLDVVEFDKLKNAAFLIGNNIKNFI